MDAPGVAVWVGPSNDRGIENADQGTMTKILVVDDNATNRKLLVTWLSAEGYLTVEAVDGSDGLSTARLEKPDLVISDILMPTMDGFEFVERLRIAGHCTSTDLRIKSRPVSKHWRAALMPTHALKACGD